MSSTNEELPPKPRVSPLDFRNTDLVSRLLAATPPYLYNMPLVPNSYFFSEMLRSLVQAKSEASNRTSLNMHHRRSRKRSWTQAKSECYKTSPKPEQSINWPPKFQEKNSNLYDLKNSDVPLELTTNKLNTCTENVSPAEDTKATVKSNLESPANSSIPSMMYPTPTSSNTQQNGNLIMPPPPVWYPSLYPSPYGIDPLHFFIDLRVSSHIYDKKNQKDGNTSSHIPSRNQMVPGLTNQHHEHLQDNSPSFQGLTAPSNCFKQTRHASAFTVPTPSIMKTSPMNLSNDKERTESRNTKFDVKSMGFDKSYHKTSTNYIMSNIENIYKTVAQQNCESQEIEVSETPVENNLEKEEEKIEYEESDEQKKKKVKDISALIGLELVVDYMNHAKPGQSQEAYDDSSVDADSTASSAVEVVSVEESSPDVLTY